jgi:hypothetical protein
MKSGERIDFSNYKNLKQGDVIRYNGGSGVIIEDQQYTLGLRCNGRSINNILNDCDDVTYVYSVSRN